MSIESLPTLQYFLKYEGTNLLYLPIYRRLNIFCRFPRTKIGSLLNIYYEKEKELSHLEDNFIKYIKQKLDKMGMTNLWREQLIQNIDFSKDTKLIKNITTRLKDITSQTILSAVENNEGKLRFFKEIKNNHNFETYLLINNLENRRAITKLRTSSHKLEIETGRYNKIPRDQRLCKNCILNKIEDENHLLFECHMYEMERKEFHLYIKENLNVDLSKNETPEKKIQKIFYSEHLGALNALGKFIKNALQKRDKTICHIHPPHYVYYQTIT